ncbi:hypothetical protein [Streptomyces sp. NBC_01235]|nr:hypothetical protein OG289_38685 [Streptomyces sp. NBC_01235]
MKALVIDRTPQRASVRVVDLRCERDDAPIPGALAALPSRARG